MGWGQIQTLLDRVDNRADRDWYATRSSAYGWSRNTLVHHIKTQLKLRTGNAPDNFTTTLPAADTDAVRELVHDPVRLNFLTLDPVGVLHVRQRRPHPRPAPPACWSPNAASTTTNPTNIDDKE